MELGEQAGATVVGEEIVDLLEGVHAPLALFDGHGWADGRDGGGDLLPVVVASPGVDQGHGGGLAPRGDWAAGAGEGFAHENHAGDDGGEAARLRWWVCVSDVGAGGVSGGFAGCGKIPVGDEISGFCGGITVDGEISGFVVGDGKIFADGRGIFAAGEITVFGSWVFIIGGIVGGFVAVGIGVVGVDRRRRLRWGDCPWRRRPE